MEPKGMKEEVMEGQENLQRMQFLGEEKNIVQLIVFNLGEEEFGVRIDDVREIIRVGAITPIPDSPEFIKGITNVRGEIITVIDLKSRFFLHPKKEAGTKHIIITKQANALFGLTVDEVTEVLRIPQEKIKKAPGLVTKIHEEYISGVLTFENRMIIILDLHEVLSEEELVKLADFQRKHVEGGKTEKSAAGGEVKERYEPSPFTKGRGEEVAAAETPAPRQAKKPQRVQRKKRKK